MKSIESQLKKAKLYEKKAQVEKAIATYYDVLIAQPKNRRASEALRKLEEPSVVVQGLREVSRLFVSGLAMQALQMAVQLQAHFPYVARVYYVQGGIYFNLKQHNEAVDCFKRAIELKPDFVEAYNAMFVSALSLDKEDSLRLDCSSFLSKGLKMKSQNAALLFHYGCLLKCKGDVISSIGYFKRSIEIDPVHAHAWQGLGDAYKSLGMKKESLAVFEQALALDNEDSEVYFSLSAVKKFTDDDRGLQIAKMEQLLQSDRSPRSQEMLHFALGKAYDDLQAYEEAFPHWLAANQARRADWPYDAGIDMRRFEKLTLTFAELDLEALKNSVGLDKRSIFIVGMPRSGTTLTEQILSSHSEVFGAGELSAVTQIVEAQLLQEQGVTPLLLDNLQREYHDYLQKMEIDASIVVDKAPFNFWWVGLMLLAMPDAKVICTHRDAAAVCWANFRQAFVRGPFTPYAYDFRDIVAYYKLFEQVMDFWKGLFPGRIYDLNYERLTENQEEETRKLLEYCDLTWQDDCLNFHENKRVV
ncbi:MAG: sulfotransferase, partial [Zetaproteobacteria bacterium]|nr:sulfotransferase [Zetaproteobacteria bacterium]